MLRAVTHPAGTLVSVELKPGIVLRTEPDGRTYCAYMHADLQHSHIVRGVRYVCFAFTRMRAHARTHADARSAVRAAADALRHVCALTLIPFAH